MSVDNVWTYLSVLNHLIFFDKTNIFRTFEFMIGFIPRCGAAYTSRCHGWKRYCFIFRYLDQLDINFVEHPKPLPYTNKTRNNRLGFLWVLRLNMGPLYKYCNNPQGYPILLFLCICCWKIKSPLNLHICWFNRLNPLSPNWITILYVLVKSHETLMKSPFCTCSTCFCWGAKSPKPLPGV